MSNIKNLGLGGSIVAIIIFIAAIYGYIENIIKLFHLPAILSGEGAIRIIGVFTGVVGAVAGYF